MFIFISSGSRCWTLSLLLLFLDVLFFVQHFELLLASWFYINTVIIIIIIMVVRYY